jgi:competence protein ComEC
LAVVVLAVLGWNAAAASVGSWLLFAAVAIIFYSLRGRFMPKHQWSRAFRLQWMLALGLAPLTLLFFQRPSLISPIANLIEVPWIGLLIGFVVLVTVTLLLLIPSLAMGLLELQTPDWNCCGQSWNGSQRCHLLNDTAIQ